MQQNFKNFIILVLKGLGMGAANVIPGVSGGTIALITGIFEKLINSIKAIDLKALKLLFSGKFKEFESHVNFKFLVAIFLGIGISIFSFAKLLGYLFDNYPVYIWAYFFGLILASVFFVGKTIDKWKLSVLISFITGAIAAILMSMLTPATENSGTIYLFICGIIAICSMILPGLSGSFVLILMGNYKLVMIDAVNELMIKILAPVALGAGFGLIAFSHILSWIYKRFKDQTISVLTGFILGSLSLLWPWKEEIIQTFANGKEKVIGYNRFIPDSLNTEVIVAIFLMLIGILSIWGIEKVADTSKN